MSPPFEEFIRESLDSTTTATLEKAIQRPEGYFVIKDIYNVAQELRTSVTVVMESLKTINAYYFLFAAGEQAVLSPELDAWN